MGRRPRRRLYPPGRSPLRDGVEPEAIVKNEAEGPFPILRGFIHSEIMAEGGAESLNSLYSVLG